MLTPQPTSAPTQAYVPRSAPTPPAGVPTGPEGGPTVPPTAAKPAGPGHLARVGMTEERGDELPLDDILREMVRLGASDVHFTSGAAPTVRLSGSLHPLEGFGMVKPEPLRRR